MPPFSARALYDADVPRQRPGDRRIGGRRDGDADYAAILSPKNLAGTRRGFLRKSAALLPNELPNAHFGKQADRPDQITI
jgi:hypothetical protein